MEINILKKVNDESWLATALFNSVDLCQQLSKGEYKETKVIKVVVKYNEIEMDGQVLEDILSKKMEQMEEFYRNKYNADNINNLVEERALELIKEHGDNAIQKINNLMEVLDNPENIIKPSWERK